MANPTDEHHQTRSKGDGSVVFDPPKAHGKSADQVGNLGYEELAQVNYHPKSINKDGKCPDGWTEIKCDDCDDVICITCDHALWESWYDIYKFKYLDPGEIEPYADENKDGTYCVYLIKPPLPAQSEFKEGEFICVRCKDNAEKCELDYRTLKLNNRIYNVYPFSDGNQCKECSGHKTFQLK